MELVVFVALIAIPLILASVVNSSNDRLRHTKKAASPDDVRVLTFSLEDKNKPKAA